MRIAVFLDVDNTLTEDFIQQQYAQALDCVPEYRQLEAQFERNLDSQAFGDAIVKLFAPRTSPKRKPKRFTRKSANRRGLTNC
jgi:phosphoserine phosphatase